MLSGIRRTFVELPRLMRAGLLVTGLGGTIDIGYHLLTTAPGAGHGAVPFIGHLVTIVGMLVTMLGLFGAALVRRPLEAKQTLKGEDQ